MKKSHKGKHRKSKSKVNGHIILLAAILVLAATAIIKLIIWNIGTKSDYDPDNIAEGYDVEALDTIIQTGRPCGRWRYHHPLFG